MAAYMHVGRVDEANELAGELEAEALRSAVAPFNLAVMHAALGHTDEAFEFLNEALGDKAQDLYAISTFGCAEALFGNLQTDPRWDAFMQRVDRELR